MSNVQLINNLPFMLLSGYSNDNIWLTVHKKSVKKGALLKNKMDGYTSIPLAHNKICDSRRANKGVSKDCICRYCYSYIQASIHPSIRSKMEHNTVQFSNLGYMPKLIYTINNRLRYISFGDVSSHIQVVNILKHAQVNGHLKKAVWSKAYGYWKGKQLNGNIENLNLIWSCSKLNCTKFIIPKGFNKSFYVYTDEEKLTDAKIQAQKEGHKVIECNKQCNACNFCYDDSSSSIVMELLKIGKGKVNL
ncbi:MAG: hypothetical protein WC877_00515 [Dehalococcoidales bacterium]